MTALRHILTVLIVALSLTSQARGTGKPDSTHCLQVEGKVLNADDADSPCAVFLYKNETVVDSIVLKGNKKKFKFILEKNQHYSIRVVKEGFQSKRVCVHTHIEDHNEELYQFYFETSLINNEVLSAAVAAADSNVPVARIYFDTKKHCFYYSRINASNYRKELCESTL